MHLSFTHAARRLSVAALGLAAVLFAAPGGAQTLTTIKVASTPVDVTGNLYYAIDQGYFKNAGLDVQIVTLSNPALMVQAVSAGDADFGTTNLVSIAQGHLGGAGVVLVAPSGGNSSKSPLEGIIVGKSTGITSAKDLNGKKMVVSVLGSIIQVEALAWIDKHGGDWKSIQWIGSPPASDGALVGAGTVDASVITEPFLSGSIANGNGTLLSYVGADISPLIIEGGYFCSEDYAAKNPDVVKKFSAALLAAGRWANGHRDDAAAIMLKYSKQTPSQTAHHAVFPETFKASDLQPLLDAAAKYGALKSTFPAAEMVAPGLR
jgi:NitT/TauT family transport system substrate-binding protein